MILREKSVKGCSSVTILARRRYAGGIFCVRAVAVKIVRMRDDE